ncbi:MAG: histidine phosphatase family protein [Mycobacterium sp.]|nr:histidine phosphatase family protein [Mycobacterium sp.]
MNVGTRLLAGLLAAITLTVAPVAACPVARGADHHNIVLTFIRHGESEANAQGIIDTKVPGPNITPLGVGQALAVANDLSVNRYDGIYASPMVRTQQTAAPLSQALGEPVTVLAGLREIEAGQNEGLNQSTAPQYPAPSAWLHGDRTARIPGSINGDEFDTRFDEAVSAIYDSGQTNPVAFSHSVAIMYWVLMNAKNADLSLEKDALPNTAHVIVTGNPRDGWTLVNWNGMPVHAPTP